MKDISCCTYPGHHLKDIWHEQCKKSAGLLLFQISVAEPWVRNVYPVLDALQPLGIQNTQVLHYANCMSRQ